MRRLIWLPVAGFLLIAGAAVAAAAPTVITRAQGLLPAAAASPAPTDSPTTPTTPTNPGKPGADGVLQKVLADLVSKGTITQAQADAITNGVQAEADNRRIEMEKLRQQWQQTRDQVEKFLADGVITQDEVDTLPTDNPLRQAFDSIAQNGQVTVDQLRQFMPFGGGHGPGGPKGFGFGHGGFGGFGGWPGAPDDGQNPPPAASPTP